MTVSENRRIVTLALNPAMDQSVHLPGLKVGMLNRALDARLDIGGKAINVAKTIAKFKQPVTLVAFLAGSKGTWIDSELEVLGIEKYIIRLTGETRTNVKLVDLNTREITEINQTGFSVNEDNINEITDVLFAQLKRNDILAISGSLPPGASAETYARIIERAHSIGVVSILDTDKKAMDAGLGAQPTVIKQNLFELQEVLTRQFTGDEDIIPAARALLTDKTKVVLVSMGGDGAILVTKDDAWRAVPNKVKVESTIGAGDAMVAAVAMGILNELPYEELLHQSTAAGTMTVTKFGSDVCDKEEMMSFLPNVTVAKCDKRK